MKPVIDKAKELLKARRERLLRCKHCKKRSTVKDLTVTEWVVYREPYGQRTGGKWMPAGWYYICPLCGGTNYSQDNPAIIEVKDAFKSKNRRTT